MEIEGDAKGKSAESGKGIKHTKRTRRSKSVKGESETQSITETVRAEIFSFLDLIASNVVKLNAESKLRISHYSSNEIQIHVDNMRSDVTSLLQMMENVQNMEVPGEEDEKGESSKETQAPKNSDFRLKSILETLKQIHNVLLDEVWPEISTSRLEIEEDNEAGGESKGTNEASQRMSTSTETKLEIELAKGMPEESSMDKVLTEEESFDLYRRGWVSNWSALCGTFTETTTLSPMYFTHCTPRDTPFAAFVANTLQMYSIKVTEIKKDLGLRWPLKVYGVVAARDTVDRNRNILFLRQRDDYQELNEKDPYLRLTGPSRAIVKEEPVRVEIELKVKGGTKSEDSVLMSKTWYYSDRLCTLYTPLAGKYCTLVLSSEELEESVQATIVGVHLTKGKPGLFKHGGRVFCSSPPRKSILPDSKHITASFRQVVLQDGAIDVCSDGYIALSRHVVSVELCRRLEVHICTYSRRGRIVEHGHVSIEAQNCNVTQHKCCLGDSELEISVAWSCLVRDKGFISREIKL